MPVSNYPAGFSGGVSIQGMSVLNTYGGNVLWVDSNAGNNGNNGTRYQPLATLNAAYDKVAADNGDIIMLQTGHTEDMAAATEVVLDIAGVTILGLGTGASRPTFTYSNTAGSFEVDAANTYIENVVFKSSATAVVVGVNVDASGCSFVNCLWDFDTGGDDFEIMVDVTGVDDTTFFQCEFRAEDAAGANTGINFSTADNLKIVGNYFTGDFAIACIKNSSGTGANCVIDNNILMNTDTGAAVNCIDIDVATKGVISYNRIAGTAAAADVNLDPGSMLCIENYSVNAIDEHGILIPATSST